MIALHLARAAADDAQGAVAREGVKAASEAGIAEIDRARGRGYGDGLRRFEEDQIALEPFGGEVTLGVGNEERTRSGRLQNADLERLGLRRAGEDETGEEKQNSHFAHAAIRRLREDCLTYRQLRAPISGHGPMLGRPLGFGRGRP